MLPILKAWAEVRSFLRRESAVQLPPALNSIWGTSVKIFKVNNELELGNTVWSSQPGDKITLKAGEYGNIALKQGVMYDFENGATAADILGLGMGRGEWSASHIEIGNILITNPRIKKANIKLYYIFRKKLPFNARLEQNTSFVHANGAILNIIGNDTDAFSFGGLGAAEANLPKGVIDIMVPSLVEFDVIKSNENYLPSIFLNNLTEEERRLEFESHKLEKEKREHAENILINRLIDLDLNDFEYKALWAVNSFIREYARITGEKKIKGYSIAEFLDDLLKTVVKSLDEQSEFHPMQFIEQFNNTKISAEQVNNLSTAFLSSHEYSISEFSTFHFEHLNYSAATIGLYQEFEAMWEEYDPSKKDKWKFIEAHTSDFGVKQFLAELINARNNVVHNKVLITSHSGKNKLKTDWGARILNEYEIFAHKAPLYWRKSLSEFKISFKANFDAMKK